MSGVNLSSKTNSVSAKNSKSEDYSAEWSLKENNYGRIQASWFKGDETLYVRDIEDLERRGSLELLYRGTRMGPSESYGRFNDESDLAAKIEGEFGLEVLVEKLL